MAGSVRILHPAPQQAPSHSPPSPAPPPPPPPPLPSIPTAVHRSGVFQRLVAGLTPRPPSSYARQSPDSRIGLDSLHNFSSLPAQTVAHKTGIPITALDISPNKTHAVLAGKEILKTVSVADRTITEDVNLRSTIIQYTSTHVSSHQHGLALERRDFLSASDVKWSHGKYDSIIATAANNGRLSVYDVKRPEVELLWLHQHTRQVHRLAFNPFEGALLLSGSHDGTVRYWDLRTSFRRGAVLTLLSSKHFLGRAEAVRDLRWSPTDGVEFITSTDVGTIFKWDLRRTDRPELRINGHDKACYALDWHPDGRHVISGGADKFVCLWDFKTSDRRQKPRFKFRVPHTVMNLRWRPASSSSSVAQVNAERQTSQVAIGYNQDDPRIHIWDLRRPWMPVRELDRYNSPATSLLWCTDDRLWTVGKEGMFTQTDVQQLAQPPQEVSPCSMAWLATGEHLVFTEDRRTCRGSVSSQALSVSLLGSNHEELSGGEQGFTSRSWTDDEGIHDRFRGLPYRAARANRASIKSAKSLGNTPPSRDDQPPISSLDETILQDADGPAHRQVGIIGKTTAATTDAETAGFLAENYLPPSTEIERRQNPADILKRLEEVFKVNACVCQQVSRHRLAQSWRVLGAVILPELRAWADRKRRERLRQVLTEAAGPDTEIEPTGSTTEISSGESKANPWAVEKRPSVANQTRSLDLFKGLLRSDGKASAGEEESTSTVTTPLARPFVGSTISTPSRSPRPLLSVDEAVGPILQLPPAVMASHSAAAAASQALRVEVDRPVDVQAPSISGPSTETADDAKNLLLDPSERRSKQQSLTPQVTKRSKSDWVESREPRADDERQLQSRRAALGEYKAQSRPLLSFDTSFEESNRPGLPIPLNRHNSSDSLQMFSESGSSSHRAKSMTSSGSMEASFQSKSSTYSDEWALESRRGLEQSASSHEDDMGLHQPRLAVEHPQRSGSRLSNRSTSLFPEVPFEFEEPGDHPIRTPLRSISRSPLADIRPKGTDRAKSPSPTAGELQSADYIYADFQPIDVSSYQPNGGAKPWAALPLIAQAIDFDLGLGDNHAQFSSHLLMHVHPFFFHRKFRHNNAAPDARPPSTVAERLRHPHLAHRIIESVFTQYHVFLKSLSLHVQAAELRKVCVALDLPFVYRPRLNQDGDDPEPTASSTSNDGFTIPLTCTNPDCRAPLSLLDPDSDLYVEPMSCSRCRSPRPPCPLCRSIKSPTVSPSTWQQNPRPWKQQRQRQRQRNCRNSDIVAGTGLWSFCPTCGHSAHGPCMANWLRRSGTQGECPTPGCGHDCGPGEVRQQRMAELASASDPNSTVPVSARSTFMSKMVSTMEEASTASSDGARTVKAAAPTPPTTSFPRDPWRSRQSPAVDRTRGLLFRNNNGPAPSHATSSSAVLSASPTAPASALDAVDVTKPVPNSDPEPGPDKQESIDIGDVEEEEEEGEDVEGDGNGDDDDGAISAGTSDVKRKSVKVMNPAEQKEGRQQQARRRRRRRKEAPAVRTITGSGLGNPN